MGGTDSKIENPNANVINDIVVKIEFPTIYMIIIIALIAMQLLVTVYQLHKRSLRKTYIRTASLAGTLDKV